MNKQQIKVFAIITLLLALVLTGCNKQEIKEEKIKTQGKVQVSVKTQEEDKQDKKEEKGEIEEKDIDNMRSQITLDDINNDIYNIYYDKELKPKNKVEEEGIKFLREILKSKEERLTDNINGGIREETYKEALKGVDKKLIRKFRLLLDIKAYPTNTKVKEGVVYINGIKMGEIRDGKFEKEFKWPKGIELFNILVRAPGYGDGMLKINSINGKGSLLMGTVILKRAIEKEVDLSKAKEISTNDMKLRFGECSFVDREGKCVKEKVKARINFISGKEANEGRVSLIRRAKTKEGKLVSLISGGMAYIDLIRDNGEILKVAPGKKVEIVYNISPEDIKTMKDRRGLNKQEARELDETEGYWYFNKNTGLREQKEAEIRLDRDKLEWIAKVKEIY